MALPNCLVIVWTVERMACWNTPVQKVLNQLMKESDNLNAEAFLCRLGAQATGKKQVAAEDGIVEIMKLIRRPGHDPKDYKIADGCGLSNYNYLSPALLVDFPGNMRTRKQRCFRCYINLFPLAEWTEH